MLWESSNLILKLFRFNGLNVEALRVGRTNPRRLIYETFNVRLAIFHLNFGRSVIGDHSVRASAGEGNGRQRKAK